jgi:hypothetical protein
VHTRLPARASRHTRLPVFCGPGRSSREGSGQRQSSIDCEDLPGYPRGTGSWGPVRRPPRRACSPRPGAVTSPSRCCRVRGLPQEVTAAPWWQEAAGGLRAGLREAAGVLPAASAGLLPGLAVGDSGGLTSEADADFRAGGLTHLLAVSGEKARQTDVLPDHIARYSPKMLRLYWGSRGRTFKSCGPDGAMGGSLNTRAAPIGVSAGRGGRHPLRSALAAFQQPHLPDTTWPTRRPNFPGKANRGTGRRAGAPPTPRVLGVRSPPTQPSLTCPDPALDYVNRECPANGVPAFDAPRQREGAWARAATLGPWKRVRCLGNQCGLFVAPLREVCSNFARLACACRRRDVDEVRIE